QPFPGVQSQTAAQLGGPIAVAAVTALGQQRPNALLEEVDSRGILGSGGRPGLGAPSAQPEGHAKEKRNEDARRITRPFHEIARVLFPLHLGILRRQWLWLS